MFSGWIYDHLKPHATELNREKQKGNANRATLAVKHSTSNLFSQIIGFAPASSGRGQPNTGTRGRICPQGSRYPLREGSQ